jgi:hypothetical protein
VHLAAEGVQFRAALRPDPVNQSCDHVPLDSGRALRRPVVIMDLHNHPVTCFTMPGDTRRRATQQCFIFRSWA